MEGLLNFIADHYIWFAGISVFFAFALIGLIYETKKKKKAESKTADAVAQPVAPAVAPATAQEPGVVVNTPVAQQEVLAPGAPSLEGLEAKPEQYDNAAMANIMNQTPAAPVMPEGPAMPEVPETPAPSAEPTLVIEDPSASAPSAEPSLIIEDPSAQAPAVPTPEAPVADTPVAPEVPVQNPTLGNPGQPPM